MDAIHRTLVEHGLPGGGPIHLVGHSYGGAVALELALAHPGLFASLTMYEPVRFALLRNHQPQAAWWDVVNAGESIRRLGSLGQWHSAAARFTDYWGGDGAWSGMPLARQDMVAARTPKVVAEFGALFSDDMTARRLASLTLPVRVLRGTTSPFPARDLAALIAGAVPNGELVTLEGLGHMGPIEAPGKVMGVVLESLNSEEALA